MSSGNAARLLAAMEMLAAADGGGLRVFKVRGQSTCVAELGENRDGTVMLRSFVGLEGAPNGRDYALSAVCYFADVFDVCLTADDRSIFRDVGGGAVGSEWLQRHGFLSTRTGEQVRLPRSLKSRIAA